MLLYLYDNDSNEELLRCSLYDVLGSTEIRAFKRNTHSSGPLSACTLEFDALVDSVEPFLTKLSGATANVEFAAVVVSVEPFLAKISGATANVEFAAVVATGTMVNPVVPFTTRVEKETDICVKDAVGARLVGKASAIDVAEMRATGLSDETSAVDGIDAGKRGPSDSEESFELVVILA